MGSAVEAIETDDLVRQEAVDIINDFYDKSMPLDDLIEEVHNKFRTKGLRMQRMDGQDEYKVTSARESNINAWKEAESVADGKDMVSAVESLFAMRKMIKLKICILTGWPI